MAEFCIETKLAKSNVFCITYAVYAMKFRFCTLLLIVDISLPVGTSKLLLAIVHCLSFDDICL